MNKKRAIGVGLAVVACGGLILLGKSLDSTGSAVVQDDAGNQIAELVLEDGKLRYQCEDKRYESYVDIVCQEAVALLQKEEGISGQEAAKELVDKEIAIETWLNQDVLDAVTKAYANGENLQSKRFGAAVSDKEGHLMACYSDTKGNETYNNVMLPTYAGSTMKPLSIYGPAIDEGLMCWSTLFEDSAYMTVQDEDGLVKGWPENVKDYTGEEITVAQAVWESNNAVAVKALKEYGVQKSVAFLKNTLGYDVEEEEKILETDGEDKILSNIALGDLSAGVTVYQMLDKYQVFANEGIDTPLQSIKAIWKSGEICWEPERKETQVFQKTTAYIMNRMLRKVVTDGTGKEAQIEGVDICGKTGTSGYGDHWFIGMIPENICAVWFQEQQYAGAKTADIVKIGKEIIEQIADTSEKNHSIPDGIVARNYCKKSGQLAGAYCKEIEAGYYSEENIPGNCEKCK